MQRTALLALGMSLAGCETIQQHPVATSVAVAFVAGSIVASTHHDDQRGGAAPSMAHIGNPVCTGGSCQ
jgi:hypothetical protein